MRSLRGPVYLQRGWDPNDALTYCAKFGVCCLSGVCCKHGL